MSAPWPCEQPPGGVTVAVAALVTRGDRILLVQRGKEPAAGKWSLPGGPLLLGEPLAGAVTRELEEETALAATRVGDLVEVTELVRPQAGLHYLIHVFRVEVDPEAEAAAGDDAAALRWCSAEEVGDLDTTAGLRDFLGRHGAFAAPSP